MDIDSVSDCSDTSPSRLPPTASRASPADFIREPHTQHMPNVSLVCGGQLQNGQKHYGFFVVPAGKQWVMQKSDGQNMSIPGPSTVRAFGETLTEMRNVSASETEYIELSYTDGHSEILPGPASIFFDPVCHTNILVKSCVSLTTSELLVVYRESLDAKAHSRKVSREIVRGPCLYKPQTCGEWTHKFSWHGHDPSGGELARKRPNGLKFEKLQTAPASVYFDVENVRTSDDALLTVRLMIFYQLTDVEAMINATNDPIAEIINSVTADVIGFCSVRSFEQFKESAEQLNMIGVYQNLTTRAAGLGLHVSKVVFRGYMAPQRLQKMHDDAIERRTKLVLERESELQEQKLKDDRLAKEEEREKVKRQMERAQAEHTAQMTRERFTADMTEQRETAEQKAWLQAAANEAELAHLQATRERLGLQGADMAQILVARTQGAPAKLIQITRGVPDSAVQINETA